VLSRYVPLSVIGNYPRGPNPDPRRPISHRKTAVEHTLPACQMIDSFIPVCFVIILGHHNLAQQGLLRLLVHVSPASLCGPHHGSQLIHDGVRADHLKMPT
jgi:hypothetical protein